MGVASASAAMRLLFVLGLLVKPATAGLFLARIPEPELKRVLLVEIEAAIGSNLHDVTKQRISEIREALRPSFDVLPKNEDGKLDHDGVRYLLNRAFAQQHGWSINGLQSGTEVWNSSDSSSKLSMRDYLPEVLQELFEKRVGAKGAGLEDLVALGAIIEHLIRDELRGKLETVYQAKEVLLEDVVDKAQAVNLMELYMICFLRGEDASRWDATKLAKLEKHFHRQYPEWEGVKLLIEEVQAAATEQSKYTFDGVAAMLEVVANRFASFYESQCHELKGALLDMEERRTGRVRLGDFYKAALDDGMYQFTESIEVLRHIGTLDEVDTSNPRVIIPNYVAGLSNCVARTSFYSTCCPNTCEALLNRVERALGKAEATPAEITIAMEDPTASLESGFQGLSPWLRHRLDDLAQHHNGRIPLHGRLFAQWMHFLHPRDCMYPHVSGTTYKKSLDEWEKDAGQSSGLTLQELKTVTQRLSEVASPSRSDLEEEPSHEGMWTMEEELFVERVPSQQDTAVGQQAGPAKTAMYAVGLAVVLAAVAMLRPSSKKLGTLSFDDAKMSKSV